MLNAASIRCFRSDDTFEQKLGTLPLEEDNIPGMEVVPILLQDDDLSILDPPPPEEEEPIHVKPQDVLFGRGGAVNKHWGNQTFHVEKAKVQWRYLQADKRREKRAVAQTLMDLMKQRHGSRFLDYCKKKKEWYKSDALVLEKIKQALRENLTIEQRKEKREHYKRKNERA